MTMTRDNELEKTDHEPGATTTGNSSDTADHKYAYGFDFDVMHPFMSGRSCRSSGRASVLELGSFKGDFTDRLLPHFNDITCVEASGEAIASSRARLGDRVKFVHCALRDGDTARRYDNIVLTHVLEHLDDPVARAAAGERRVAADGGRLFLVCPNANAPRARSRCRWA